MWIHRHNEDSDSTFFNIKNEILNDKCVLLILTALGMRAYDLNGFICSQIFAGNWR